MRVQHRILQHDFAQHTDPGGEATGGDSVINNEAVNYTYPLALGFTMAPNTKWIVEWDILYRSSAVADFDVNINAEQAPFVSHVKFQGIVGGALVVAVGGAVSENLDLDGQGAGTTEVLKVKAFVHSNLTTAGLLRLGFRQVVAEVSDTKILGESYFTAKRIG